MSMLETLMEPFLEGEMAQAVMDAIRKFPPAEGETPKQYIERLKKEMSSESQSASDQISSNCT